jgi:hypothetical protein
MRNMKKELASITKPDDVKALVNAFENGKGVYFELVEENRSIKIFAE